MRVRGFLLFLNIIYYMHIFNSTRYFSKRIKILRLTRSLQIALIYLNDTTWSAIYSFTHSISFIIRIMLSTHKTQHKPSLGNVSRTYRRVVLARSRGPGVDHT